MQFFVKLLTGKTITLDIDNALQTKVIHVINEIARKNNDWPWASPRYALLFGGKNMRDNDQATLGSIGVVKESTFHLALRMHCGLYVQWHGAHWLQSKVANYAHNFYTDLADALGRYNSCSEPERVPMTNCTVWHVKKVVAEFVCLEPHEIDLYFYSVSARNDSAADHSVYTYGGEPPAAPFERPKLPQNSLPNEMLVTLDRERDFVVTIAKPIRSRTRLMRNWLKQKQRARKRKK